MGRSTKACALATLALTGAACANGVFWDNNIVSDGFNGRALSPPGFPDIRVADDFVVEAGGTVIKGANFGVIEDESWIAGDVLEVTFYADSPGFPGDIVAVRSGPFDRIATGRQLFDRDEYHYLMEFDGVALGDGTHWVGVRNPLGRGAGTNYWLTSSGGPDGMGTDTGWVLLGFNWQPEGPGHQHAFELIPTPAALAAFAVSALLPGRRRRDPSL